METAWCFSFYKQNGAQARFFMFLILFTGTSPTISPPVSMEVFQSPRLFPEIPLRFAPIPLDSSSRRRITFFRPLSADGDSRSGAPVSESRNRMFILGMGFVGGFFAQQLKEADWSDFNFSSFSLSISFLFL